jgi:23S rRNA pseudouridine1911/1915/1917 synthase
MNFLEFQWLNEEASLKVALQNLLGASGQLLKKHFSNKELSRSIRPQETTRLPLDLVNHLKINPVYIGPSCRVLHETIDYLAIHKPGGVHCHPLRYSDRDTLLNFLAAEGRWDALKINQDHYDRGLLYRLDYETSGVVLLAKTSTYFQKIRHDFHAEVHHKLYLALVKGSFDKEGSWTHYFKSTGLKGSKQKVSEEFHPDASTGSLKVIKILEENGYSLVMIDLRSGLRHQIRAQLAFLGFPLVGDELYGGDSSARLYLHAWRYEWSESIEDSQADLFESVLDLDRALKMSHDMLGRIKGR